MPGKSIVYWDSCAFIAHLRREQTKRPEALFHLKQMLESARDGDLEIVTSSLVVVEVLDTHLSTEAQQDFERMTNYGVRGISIVDPNIMIMRKAREIREQFKENSELWDALTTCTPDSIHLATALAANCEKFYTFDGIAPRDAKATALKLLELDGYIPGLTIVAPYMEDPSEPQLFSPEELEPESPK